MYKPSCLLNQLILFLSLNHLYINVNIALPYNDRRAININYISTLQEHILRFSPNFQNNHKDKMMLDSHRSSF